MSRRTVVVAVGIIVTTQSRYNNTRASVPTLKLFCLKSHGRKRETKILYLIIRINKKHAAS